VFDEGLSWRRFQALLAGLSFESLWRWWLRSRPLEGEEAEKYFASI